MGIEPTYPAWKAGVLPLNYTRVSCAISDTTSIISYVSEICKHNFIFLYFLILLVLLFTVPVPSNAFIQVHLSGPGLHHLLYMQDKYNALFLPLSPSLPLQPFLLPALLQKLLLHVQKMQIQSSHQ